MTYDVLIISGSLRIGSVNQAVVRTAQRLAPEGVSAHVYPWLGELPHFNPDDDREPLHPAVADLRAQVGRARAVLFCTPEYAGALPGAFKNLLDWTVGGGEMDRKLVAWINTAGPAAPTGGEDAHASLRRVLGYLGAEVVDAACARIPVMRQAVGPDGLVSDAAIRAEIEAVLDVLLSRVRLL
jgi:NAD(P)H-dependent FMN reductase